MMSAIDIETRLALIEADHQGSLDAFTRDVREGLTSTPKYLSCHYFYDERGSALFEAICDLPEYYLTRAERQILESRAGEIAALFDGSVSLVELGSGSAVKTRLLIEALLRRQGALRYAPLDISRPALEQSALALLEDYEQLEVVGVIGLYEEGLAHLRRAIQGPRLVLWLGSSVGNFETAAAEGFLGEVAASMDAEDRLLIGMDLDKDRAVLERAYDDAQGVTAAFNLNLLARINRAFDGNFALGNFAHRAHYDQEKRRIEMHLESLKTQSVRLEALGLEVSFAAGERVHTENAHKYRQEDIEALLQGGSFALEHQYFDDAQRFSLNLARPLGPQAGTRETIRSRSE